MKKIAIIGSRDLFGKTTFDELVKKVKDYILSEYTDNNYTFISGGSSWADFVAVILKIELPQSHLLLYLPANFTNKRFIPTYLDKGAALTLNNLHNKFYNQTGIDSLKMMSEIQYQENVNYIVHPGFLNRNDYISKECDMLIALSHGNNIPDTPGTLYTWNKCQSKKIHIHVD